MSVAVVRNEYTTFTQQFTAAQTNTVLLTSTDPVRIAVSRITVKTSNANTADVSYRMGFGSSTCPAYGSVGLVSSAPGIAPGSGSVEPGVLFISDAGQSLLFTCSDPTSGAVDVSVTAYGTPFNTFPQG